MSIPENEHYAQRQQLRFVAKHMDVVTINSADLTPLLDYIDELEREIESLHEDLAGEDL